MAKRTGSAPPPPNTRREAARILYRVTQEEGYANRLLDHSLQQHQWDPRDAGLLTELVYGTLRSLLPIDTVLGRLASKGLRSIDTQVLQHLRIALYQLMYLERVPEHAAVSQAVAQVRKQRGGRVAGFANALLRKCLREPQTLAPPETEDALTLLEWQTSHPRWLIERLQEQVGEELAAQWLNANNQPAPLTLRVNRLWGTRAQLLKWLQEGGLDAQATSFSPDGVHIQTGQAHLLRALQKQHPHAFVIQDEAAQLLGLWLEPQPGETILDACAAPGGKTTHIAALAPEATVIATDVHEHKISLIQQSSRRLQLTNVQARQADATAPLPMSFDRILCDAPCSGLGILRRQPEIRYRRTPEDLSRLATLQGKLLHNLANFLKPGGTLIFSVCTTTKEESTGVLQTFLDAHPDFSISPAPADTEVPWSSLLNKEGHLRTSPLQEQMDGFFGVRLCKEE